jgi:hypothetical protein
LLQLVILMYTLAYSYDVIRSYIRYSST